MKRTFCKSTLYIAMAMGAGVAIPAYAQTAPAPEATAPEAAPPPPPADSAASADDSVEEIVVTARRVEERAQDVPISMTVFSQKDLTEKGISSGVDLAKFTPSLATQSEFGSDNTSFAMRGFTQSIGTTASVAVYFADVVAPRGGAAITTGDGAGPGAFFDLQNVQVLKGPQGTLFGRNTDGGAVLLVPQKPTGERSGYVDAGYGNYDAKTVDGVFNLPVSDNFRLRFAAIHQDHNGYLKDESPVRVGPKDFSDQNYTAARVSAVWDITPSIENYTIASYSFSNHHGNGERILACTPESAAGAFGGCDQYERGLNRDFFTTENNMSFANSKLQQFQLINTTSWTVNDNLVIKNIASYAQLKNTVYNDLFSTNWNLGGVIPLDFSTIVTAPGHDLNHIGDTTEELQFQFHSTDTKLIAQLGLYAEFNEPIGKSGVTSDTLMNCTDIFTLQCTDYVGVGSVNYQVGKIRYHDLGAYEQASYSITDKLKLTEGLRYTMDSSTANYDEGVYRFLPAAEGYPGTIPTLFCSFTSNPYYATPAPNVDACAVHFQQNSYAATWITGLDFKVTDDILLYGKYSRGYRQGSVSPTAAEGANIYKPEKVESFEVGNKNSFHSFVRGTFNVAAFYNNFRDQQLTEGFQCSTQCATPSQGIINAGHSHMYGFEVESTISPFKGATLAVSYANINTKLVSIQAIPPPAGSPYDIINPTADVGASLPLTPRNKVVGTAAYVLPIPSNLGKVAVSATETYQSGEIQTSYNSDKYNFKSPGYAVTNLNLDWTAIGHSPVDVSLFAMNVFDRKYEIFNPGLYTAVGFEPEQVGDPLTYGGRVRYNFGG